MNRKGVEAHLWEDSGRKIETRDNQFFTASRQSNP